MPATTSITTVQAAAEKNSRNASELARIGQCEQVTEASYRLDYVDPQLLANPSDEHLDGVGIAIKVLVVKMLDQLRARHHAAGMMHEIGEQPIFVRGELDRIAIHRDAPGAGVEPHRPAVELALGVAGRASQQRPDPRQHPLEMKRLGAIVVAAGIEALHLVAPAVTGRPNQYRHGPP